MELQDAEDFFERRVSLYQVGVTGDVVGVTGDMAVAEDFWRAWAFFHYLGGFSRNSGLDLMPGQAKLLSAKDLWPAYRRCQSCQCSGNAVQWHN